jgi:hypothetical protein
MKSTQNIVDAWGEKEGGRTQAGGPAQSLLGRQKEWARHPESGRTGALRRRSMMLAGRFSIPIGRGQLGEVFLLQGRQLGEGVVEGNELVGRRMCPGYGPDVREPEPEGLQNPPGDLGVLNGGNDSHPVPASGTDQGVRLVHLRDQTGPVSFDLP